MYPTYCHVDSLVACHLQDMQIYMYVFNYVLNLLYYNNHNIFVFVLLDFYQYAAP